MIKLFKLWFYLSTMVFIVGCATSPQYLDRTSIPSGSNVLVVWDSDPTQINLMYKLRLVAAGIENSKSIVYKHHDKYIDNFIMKAQEGLPNYKIILNDMDIKSRPGRGEKIYTNYKQLFMDKGIDAYIYISIRDSARDDRGLLLDGSHREVRTVKTLISSKAVMVRVSDGKVVWEGSDYAECDSATAIENDKHKHDAVILIGHSEDCAINSSNGMVWNLLRSAPK